MIILDATTRSLEIDLNAVVTTNQLPFVASYVDMAKGTMELVGGNSNTGTSNGTTAVTLVAAPGANVNRHLKFLSIRNADTVAAVLWIQVNDNSTLREIWKGTLSVDDSFIVTDDRWVVMTSSGSAKESGGVDGPSSSTDNAVARFNGTGGTAIQNSGVIIDDSNNVTGVVALTVSGTLTLSGTAANIATGANFISYDGTDAGLSLDASNNATLSGTLTVSGGQIAFPATQAASADANTLDDYEEGTWSPTRIGFTEVGGAPTLTGFYTKVGRLVYFTIHIVPVTTVACVGGTSNISLPFVNRVSSGSTVTVSDNSSFVGEAGAGHIHTDDQAVYPPSWTASGNTKVVSGVFITS